MVFPYFGLDAPAVRALIVLALMGLPFALALAWCGELREGRIRLRPGIGGLTRANLLVTTGVAVAGVLMAGGTLRAGVVASGARIEIHEPGVWNASEMASAGERGRYALVVGVSEYGDPEIADLAYAADDARAVAEFLRSPAAGLGGFPDGHVVLLTDRDATKSRIEAELAALRERTTEEDILLLYFAGHGAVEPADSSEYYIMAHDTRPNALEGTAVAMTRANAMMRDARAHNKILLADVAMDGRVIPEDLIPVSPVSPGAGSARSTAGPGAFGEYLSSSSGGFVAFTASEMGQMPREGPQWDGGHGVFTYFLLEGLRGMADEDQDGVVTLGEMMEYTRDRVRRATANAQIPTISQTTYDRFWPMAEVLPDDA